jgi:hypothetical protein
MVCRESYIHGWVLFARTSDFAGAICSELNRMMDGSYFVRRDFLRIRRVEANVGYPAEPSRLDPI